MSESKEAQPSPYQPSERPSHPPPPPPPPSSASAAPPSSSHRSRHRTGSDNVDRDRDHRGTNGSSTRDSHHRSSREPDHHSSSSTATPSSSSTTHHYSSSSSHRRRSRSRSRSGERRRKLSRSPDHDRHRSSHRRDRRSPSPTESDRHASRAARQAIPFGERSAGAQEERLRREAAATNASTGGAVLLTPDMDEAQMMAALGLPGNFDTTQGKEVKDGNVAGVRVQSKRQYRQYMNRVGGFNRLLAPSY